MEVIKDFVDGCDEEVKKVFNDKISNLAFSILTPY
jgi:hypothetical protein